MWGESLKKVFLGIALLSIFLLSGCGKYDHNDIVRDLSKKIDSINGYYIEGEMAIISNDDTYKYEVKSSYQKENLFRVSLKNKDNNHEQIILRNEDGVYVLTPSLNKSFKFQSEWPYNNSQVYLLQTILRDLKNDKKKMMKETKNYYVFTTTVNYPNNKSLKKQVIYMDKKLNIKEIHVLNVDNQKEISFKITKMDMKATFNTKYFTLSNNMEAASINNIEIPVIDIDSIIYPMYIPANTSLNAQDSVTTENGERLILTFVGEKPFILVEEAVAKQEELTIVPMSGEPVLLSNTIGALSDNSITWIVNGVEYYIASDSLSKDELVMISESIASLPVMK